jgi:hypothetical protein
MLGKKNQCETRMVQKKQKNLLTINQNKYILIIMFCMIMETVFLASMHDNGVLCWTVIAWGCSNSVRGAR